LSETLREYGFGRHQRALEIGGVPTSVAASPGQGDMGILWPGDRGRDCRGVLATRWFAIHCQDHITRSHAGKGRRAIRDGFYHHYCRASPGEAQTGTCPADAALAILTRITRRHITGIGVQMIEQLVEEALDDALASSSQHQRRIFGR